MQVCWGISKHRRLRIPDVLRRILGPLGRGAFRPASLPADLAVGLAVAPSLLAGLLLFRLAAAEMLAIGVAAGVMAHLGARLARQPLQLSPVLPAVIAVSLIGPGAPLYWVAAAAGGAALIEIARSRWLRGARIEAGLVAYSIVFLVGRGILGSYLNPGSSRPLAEPIRLWEAYFGGSVVPFDAVKLYVGNVPGPVFATSLLTVAIGAAWLWYARRLSLAVMIGFLAGAALPIWLYRWDAGFQLDSGPAWFVVALILADRGTLPKLSAARLLIGVAAGVAALALRARGEGIEALFLAAAGLQLAVAVIEGVCWLVAERKGVWLRSRETTARLWKGARAFPAGRRAA